MLSFQWSTNNSSDPASGSGGGAGKTTATAFKFVKAIDGATVKLFKAATSGERVRQVNITIFRPGTGGETLETLTLEETAVVSRTEAHTGVVGEIPLEEVSIKFAKATEAIGSQSATWDFAAGTPSAR